MIIPAVAAATQLFTYGANIHNRRKQVGAWNDTQDTKRRINGLTDPAAAINETLSGYSDPYGLDNWRVGVI